MALFVVLDLLMSGHSGGAARFADAGGVALSGSFLVLIFGLAVHIMKERDLGQTMGIVIFGMSAATYVGPQMIGALRDVTGGFAAGFYLAASFGVLAIILAMCLEIFLRKSTSTSSSLSA